MVDIFSRTRILTGETGLARLRAARVAVIGLGGVGGYALEALARAGVGRLFLLDAEAFDVTNLNRQILVTAADVGRPKVDVARERVLSINPEAKVETHRARLTPENTAAEVPEGLTGAIDAIDDVAAKVELITLLYERRVPFVSCMGAGSRLDPEGLRVADISGTRGCPLARTVRQRLRRRSISHGVPCVFFETPPCRLEESEPDTNIDVDLREGRPPIGSMSYPPGLVGLTAAGVLINTLLRAAPSGPAKAVVT